MKGGGVLRTLEAKGASRRRRKRRGGINTQIGYTWRLRGKQRRRKGLEAVERERDKRGGDSAPCTTYLAALARILEDGGLGWSLAVFWAPGRLGTRGGATPCRVRRIWRLWLGYSKMGAWDGLWPRSGHQGGLEREGGRLRAVYDVSGGSGSGTRRWGPGTASGRVLGTREVGNERGGDSGVVCDVSGGSGVETSKGGCEAACGCSPGTREAGNSWGDGSASFVTCQAGLAWKRRKGGTLVACGCSAAPGG